ncbi:uncharacterized protein LOC141902832 [Tubulanus polymorphus]|uniref:uncharacterized protein LOC141902832 n=1 Tax=Tubulanus polymorphus TaxID=672921 RepID=UPI003DA4D355
MGETARFTINYDANPSATNLNCSHNSSNGKHKMNRTSLTEWDIIIQSVQASDYGSYSCKLNNSVGSIEITLKLTETGPPQTPSNLTVIAKTAVSVTLNWQSEFEGGSEQTFILSQKTSDSTQFVDIAEIPDPGYRKLVQTKITGLKPATDYQFKVKSVNSNPGDNTSPFTDIVTTRTNDIPRAINTALKQATITREGNLVLLKLSSFPSKYSVYVKYCTKYTNKCKSTEPIESTDGLISITIEIDPDQAYSYQLIVIESSDVIVSQQVEIPVNPTTTTINIGLIGGVVVGVLFVAIIVIVFVLLFVKGRRDGQWIWTKYRGNSSAPVPPPNNDIDGHEIGPSDENPYQIVGDEDNPYQDVYNDDDEEIQEFAICGVDNPAYIVDEKKEPIYLHIVNNIKHQAPPGVLIGDFDDFSTYSELGRVVEPQVQAELVARLEAEEAERRRQREEKEQQKKSY